MVVRNAFAELAQEHSNGLGDAHLVSGNKIKWRREFNNPNVDFWDEFENGITIPDPANGSIAVSMGTTANAEAWLVSKEVFTMPVKFAAGIQLSQKIAQNEIYLEMVGCDAAGNLDETRVAAWRISGTDSATATIARYEVRNGQAARLQSGNIAGLPTQVTAAVIYEITAESDEVWFSAKAMDSTTARTVAGVRNSIAPDPQGLYKLRLRFKNGATAPASATTVTLSFALAVDYTEMQVEVTGGNGNATLAQSIPVNVVAGVTATPSLAASATVAGLNASKILAAATTNPVNLKTTAARLYGYQLANLSAAWRFVRFYNKASAPTVGTDAPLFVVALPPNASIDLNLATPISFALGLGYSITGAVADLDTTAVAANDVQGTLLWI